MNEMKSMDRRDFCRLVAAAVAVELMPRGGVAAATANETQAAILKAMNSLKLDYAQFCAMPQDEREFFALVQDELVHQAVEEFTRASRPDSTRPDIEVDESFLGGEEPSILGGRSSERRWSLWQPRKMAAGSVAFAGATFRMLPRPL